MTWAFQDTIVTGALQRTGVSRRVFLSYTINQNGSAFRLSRLYDRQPRS